MSTTVLDIVQGILSDLDSDEVNSISDTTEAMQVASLVQRAFRQICNDNDIDSVKQLFQLEGVADLTRPTIMMVPEGVHSIAWIKYNRKLVITDADIWDTICYELPEDFTERARNRLSTDTNTISVLVQNNVSLLCGNNAPPSFWTSYDGYQVVFDSYDIGVEDTMHSAKSNCYGQKTPEIVIDDFTPIALPARFINLLEKDVRETAFDIWKDGAPSKIVKDANRSRVRLQRQRFVERVNNEQNLLPNYGRKR